MRIKDRLPAHANVRLRWKSRSGELLGEHTGHNVFTLAGRRWLAESNRVLLGGTRKGTLIPYFLAVGQGSDQQTVSPPGAGVQVEDANAEFLENPVEITSGAYLKEFDRPTTEPDDYSNRYICTLLSAEVSFGGSPSVPLTEVGLITSDAIATTPGGKKVAGGGFYPGTYDNGVLLAYHAFPPLTKTALFTLEVVWDFLF